MERSYHIDKYLVLEEQCIYFFFNMILINKKIFFFEYPTTCEMLHSDIGADNRWNKFIHTL